jgi:hypothetical protein
MMASPPVKRHLDFASRKGSFFLYLNESFLFLASDQGSHCESSGGIWFHQPAHTEEAGGASPAPTRRARHVVPLHGAKSQPQK